MVRWWVDVVNAPHATFFRPVIDKLMDRGDELVITTWDRGQTRALAERFWPHAIPVGNDGFTAPVISKGTAIVRRSLSLARAIKRSAPDVALSHNSYSQLLTARLLAIPSITAMDYEHQPANHLAFRLANVVLLPEAIPEASLRRYSLRRGRFIRYPGTKEEIALSDFQPDPGFRDSIGLDHGTKFAVVRPAAEGALYHRGQNSLCEEALERLASTGITVLLSPRTASQALRYAVRRVRVLSSPVSGPDLLCQADLVIGAGGTMTREAAVLGTPTYSIFEGRPGAVDGALARAGRMCIVRSREELPFADHLRPRLEPWSGRLETRDNFINALCSALNSL